MTFGGRRSKVVLHLEWLQVKFPVKRKGYLIHGLNDDLVMKLLAKRAVKLIDLLNIDWFKTIEIFNNFSIAILRVCRSIILQVSMNERNLSINR